MAANNDNSMTRFLFAILKQKNLKDIDWNQVARDDILLEKISNGHAARMRYSRFRAAMLGLEPQKRNRTANPKSKVTKPKKESKLKKEDYSKLDSTTDPSGSSGVKTESIQVKYESTHSRTDPSTTSASAAMSLADSHGLYQHTRLLTPCSDTDLLTSPGYAGSPVSDMLQPDAPFDFAVTSDSCGHEQGSWQPDAHFQMGMAYDMNGYAADYCGHQQDELCVPPAVMDSPAHGPVKHEHWDTLYHEA